MERPGSLNTCATCFWVVGGENNEYELSDFDLTYRQAQRLLDLCDEDWHGTPGDIGTRLRHVFGHPESGGGLNDLLADIRDVEVSGYPSTE